MAHVNTSVRGLDSRQRREAARGSPDDERTVFITQLERWRLATLRALVRTRPERPMASVDAELEACTLTLASLRGATRARRLAERLSLDADELGLMWFVVALSSDPLLGPHAVALGGAEARRGASLALYAAVAELPPTRVRTLAIRLGPSHPLVRYALVESGDPGSVPALAPLSAPRRLCRHLAGDDAVDDLVAAAGGVVTVPDPRVLGLVDEEAGVLLERALAGPVACLLEVHGPEGVGRRTALAAAAQALGREAVAVDLGKLTTAETVAATLAALRRECLLRDALPIIAGVESVGGERTEDAARKAALQRFVDSLDGIAALVTEGDGIPVTPGRPVVRLALSVPPAPIRRAVWDLAIGASAGTADATLDEVSVRYRMGAGGIAAAVHAARAAAHARGSDLEPRDLIEGVRATIGHRFGELATRVDVTHSWDDLVVHADVSEQLDLLRARARHAYGVLETWGFRSRMPRGAGLAVLLSGPPGTGKTMVAGLLAQALDLDLYQVDLSKVVSKWIGETEKNLSRVLDAADAGHALLLFDEADALFARRTEVHGSNDRYANLEVSHLLQRIEAFGGVAVLTTNLDASIDPALRRRLAAHIVFPKPDRVERAALWERLLGEQAPRARHLDFQGLAHRFPDLTGGTIRNAVVNAAFFAAAEGSLITQNHLKRAAWNEYRALGRLCFDTKGNDP
jgi:ATPase family associated with various cellular activities (AAA)